MLRFGTCHPMACKTPKISIEPARSGKHETLPTLFVVGSALVFAFQLRAINLDTCFNRIFTSIAQAVRS